MTRKDNIKEQLEIVKQLENPGLVYEADGNDGGLDWYGDFDKYYSLTDRLCELVKDLHKSYKEQG